MNFLTPAAFGLSLLIPIIVVLYFLKLQRVERKVSSTYLWQRMVRDLEANKPWQRLQRNLLLLMQILFLIALIFTLSRPYSWSDEFTGQPSILIIDTSASMAATDIDPNRLEYSKDMVTRLVGSLQSNIPITLISAGIQAQILTASSLDRRQVIQSIQALEIEPGESDMESAIRLASAIAARRPETAIEIYTDGGVTLPPISIPNSQIRIIPIGVSGENQAISQMNIEFSPGGESINALIQIVNFNDQPVSRSLRISVDGVPFEVQELNLAARDETGLLVEDIPAGAEIIEAQLLPDSGSKDYLSLDDRAYSTNLPPQPVRVNLISQGNRFLETALSLLPGVQISQIDPENTLSIPQADIHVIDAGMPITATLPSGNLFFIAPVRSTEFFTVTGMIEHPTPVPAAENEELLRSVSLANLNILDAIEIPLPAYAHPVIITSNTYSGTRQPLLFTGENNDRRLVVLAFSLQHSDLPLQVAFPVLISNLFNWLVPDQPISFPSESSPGKPVVINVPPDESGLSTHRTVRVTRPDGQTIELDVPDSKMVFSDTTQIGIYTVRLDENNIARFAVNLFSSQESEIQPAVPKPVSTVGNQSLPATNQPRRQEWWRLFAAISLVLLALEWLVQHRSSLVFLASRLKISR